MHFLRRLILCGHTGVDVYASSNYRFADWSQPPPIDEKEQNPPAFEAINRSNRSIGNFFKSRSNRQATVRSDKTSLASESRTRSKSPSSEKDLYAISSKAKYQGKSDFEVTEFLQSLVDDESLIKVATVENARWWYAMLSKEEAWEVKNSEFVKSCQPVCLNSF